MIKKGQRPWNCVENMPPGTVSLNRASELLGVNYITAQRWAHAGLLVSSVVLSRCGSKNKFWGFTMNDLEGFIYSDTYARYLTLRKQKITLGAIANRLHNERHKLKGIAQVGQYIRTAEVNGIDVQSSTVIR